MKIVLDPGHGGSDPGAMGVPLATSTGNYLDTGIAPVERLVEKGVVLDVARRAATDLRERGYTVLLTREDDVDVPLYARTGLALAEQVDAYISIHANAGGGTGCEVWYQAGDTTSEAFARALEKGICDLKLVPNRGLKAGSAATRTNWYTFSKLANDVLIELAFVDHEKDAERLRGATDRFALGIVNGVCAALPLDTFAHRACEEEKQRILEQRDAAVGAMYDQLMAERTDLAYAIRLANGAENPDDLGGLTRAERLQALNEQWVGKI